MDPGWHYVRFVVRSAYITLPWSREDGVAGQTLIIGAIVARDHPGDVDIECEKETKWGKKMHYAVEFKSLIVRQHDI